MSWTVEDREKAIVKVDITKDANNCSKCNHRAMDKVGCNWWCCDVEDHNACYEYEAKPENIILK